MKTNTLGLTLFSCAILLAVFLVFPTFASATYCSEETGGYGEDCIYIECDCDSDCGESAFYGDPFCSGGDVFRNYKTKTCQNPGTQDAECVETSAQKLWYNCESWQTCQSGACTDINVTCESNSDCGTNGYIGDPFCRNEDVYQNYRTFTCNNAGTSQSTCSNNVSERLKDNCQYGCSNGHCEDSEEIRVETRTATNISGTQATLNGYLYEENDSTCDSYVWFEYGTSSSYGYQTTRQRRNYSGTFNQIINLPEIQSNWQNYTTYNFRAIAENCQGNRVYGQNLSFSSETGTGALLISKTVKNLTTGTGWSNSVYAKPSDVLLFMITLQTTGSGGVNATHVRDYLPSRLIYRDQLIVSGTGYTGSFASGLYLNAINPNQTVTITYQAQVASTENFGFGVTTLNNNATALTSGQLQNLASSASVYVSRSAVYGATTIPTGLTNNFWVDSFFLPLSLALLGIWMWHSGMFLAIERWFDQKKKNRNFYASEKELTKKITEIKRNEIF